jgi:hypothetical protein
MNDGGAESGVMAGDGRYAEASTTQHGAADIGLPSIAPAVEGADLGSEGPLLVADFGAAEGTNSLAPIATALDALAGRARERLQRPLRDARALARPLHGQPALGAAADGWALPL